MPKCQTLREYLEQAASQTDLASIDHRENAEMRELLRLVLPWLGPCDILPNGFCQAHNWTDPKSGCPRDRIFRMTLKHDGEDWLKLHPVDQSHCETAAG